jgi:hypothetical protein
LSHVFEHEVKNPQWYFDGENVPEFKAPPIEIAELIGQTFLCAGKDLTKYTDEKVDQGIWYLVSSSGSDFMSSLVSGEVPLPKRAEAIGNIFYLYLDCFAKRCTEVLAHSSEEGTPLNSSCYMFWDLCRFSNLEDMLGRKETQDAVLNVLEKILTIEHMACREGALHGLGHIANSCPQNVHEIIDRFLSRNKLDDKLMAYALKAREGMVL